MSKSQHRKSNESKKEHGVSEDSFKASSSKQGICADFPVLIPGKNCNILSYIKLGGQYITTNFGNIGRIFDNPATGEDREFYIDPMPDRPSEDEIKEDDCIWDDYKNMRKGIISLRSKDNESKPKVYSLMLSNASDESMEILQRSSLWEDISLSQSALSDFWS